VIAVSTVRATLSGPPPRRAIGPRSYTARVVCATAALNAAYGPSSVRASAAAVPENAVRMRPGWTITTWTPNPRTSKRSASESASTAYLLAWYTPPPGNVKFAPMELMFTMRPAPWPRMPGRTSWHMRTSPNTFVSNWRRTSSMGTLSTAPDRE
jgi:hypothetical protein